MTFGRPGKFGEEQLLDPEVNNVVHYDMVELAMRMLGPKNQQAHAHAIMRLRNS